MRNVKSLFCNNWLIVFVFTLLTVYTAIPQWKQPMHDVLITTSVVSSNGGLIASTWTGGLFRSSDNGATWYNFISSPMLNKINTLYRYKQNILASVHPDAIFISTDEGASWNPARQNLPSEVKCFVEIGSSVLAGLRNGVILKSNDNGKTWTELNLIIKNLASMAVYKNFLAAGNDKGLFLIDTSSFIIVKTIDTEVINRVMKIAAEGETIAVGTEENGIFFSHDGALTWSQSLKGLDNYSIIDLEVRNGVFYTVNLTGVFKSENNGKDWFCITLDYPVIDIKRLNFIGNDLYMFTEENGVLLSKNGAKPIIVSSGLRFFKINSLHSAFGKIYAGVEAGVYKSSDMGEKWMSSTKWNLNKMITDIESANGIMFGAAGISGILKSIDSGVNWKQSFNSNGEIVITSLAELSGKVFAGADGYGVYFYNDTDFGWYEVNNGLLNKDVLCLVGSNGSLYAGTNGGGIFVSDNNGDSWEELSPVIKSLKITSLAVSGDTIAAVAGNGIVMFSADRGTSWKEDNDVLTGEINCINILGNKIIAGTIKGVLIYNDFYDEWQEQNKGLNHLNVLCMELSGGIVYAGTDSGGVYMARIEDLETGIKDNPVVHISEILFYPQPASDNISISIPGPLIDAEISITDEFGRLIKREILINNSISTVGLAPGIYFCCVNSGISKYSGKFIVIR